MGASFGPTLTSFGPVLVRLVPTSESSSPFASESRSERRSSTLVTDTLRVVVEATWRETKPEIELRVPGFDPVVRTASGSREEFNLSDQL